MPKTTQKREARTKKQEKNKWWKILQLIKTLSENELARLHVFSTHLLWLHLGLRTTDIDINPLRFKLANPQVKVRIPNKRSMWLWKADLWLSWDSDRKLWIQCIPGKLEGWTHRGSFPWKTKEPRRKQFILQEESFRMHKSGLKTVGQSWRKWVL